MRLELRASGGALCDRCGATELLHTAGTHEAFVAELTDHLANRNQRFESDALTVVRAKCDQLQARVRQDVEQLEREIRAVYRDELTALRDQFDGYLAHDIARLRFLKRRYRDELREELQAQADALLARTHLI